MCPVALTDGEYDRQYWQRLECNWKHWKNVKQAEGVKGRLTAVHKVVEEKGGKIEDVRGHPRDYA